MRESGVLAFGLGLRWACEGAWGRAKWVFGAGRTRLRTADVDVGSSRRQAGGLGSAVAGGIASR